MKRDRQTLIAIATILILGVAAMVYLQEGEPQDDLEIRDAIQNVGDDNQVSRAVGKTDIDGESKEKPAEVVAKNPATVGLDAPKDDCSHVVGRVVTREKKGVAGAVVALCLDISDFRSRSRLSKVIEHVVANEEGYFQLKNVHVGEIYSLRAECPDFASKYVTGLQLEAGNTKIYELVMHKGITLKGIVTDLGDAPVANAKVTVVDAVMQVTDKLGGVERETVTDAEGRFTVANLNQGFKNLRASKAGFASKQIFNFHVHPSQADHDIKFKMGPGEALPGRVIDDDGNGVPNVEITATPHDPRQSRIERTFSQTRSDENGNFEFPGLKRGSYYLSCKKLGYYSINRRDIASTANGEVTIRLKQNPIIRGRVVDADTNEPVKEFTLFSTPRKSLLFVSENAKQRFESEDGSFEFRCLRNQGDVYLHVESQEYADGTSSRIVLSRQRVTEDVVIKANRGAFATGRVLDKKGNPVVGAKVEFETVPDGSQGLGKLGSMVYGKLALLQRKVKTDAEGKFRVTRLRVGNYRIHVSHGSHAAKRGSKLHNITQGGEFPVGDLTLSRGGNLAGVAYDSDNKPMAGVLVKLVPENAGQTGGFDIETKTDSKGAYRFRHLEEGPYKLQIIRTARLAQIAGQIPNLPTAKYLTVFVTEGEDKVMDIRGL